MQAGLKNYWGLGRDREVLDRSPISCVRELCRAKPSRAPRRNDTIVPAFGHQLQRGQCGHSTLIREAQQPTKREMLPHSVMNK